MKKPNFERIASLWDADIFANFDHDKFVKQYNESWGERSEVELPFPLNPLLVELLDKYNLTDRLPDFEYIGYKFMNGFKSHKSKVKHELEHKGHDLELLQALKLLLDNDKGLTLNLIKLQKVQVKIQNPKLISLIKEGLLEYYQCYDDMLRMGNPPPKDIKDWGKYINERITEEKERFSRKGRRSDNFQTKRFVYYLWKYLQEFTDIKTQSTAMYSITQAKFIFRFLEIYGLIENPALITNKEDVIAYYLKAYLKEH